MTDTRLTHTGIVESINGELAVVAVAVQGCASCGERKSCGVGKISGKVKTSRVTLPAPAGLQVGQAVTLSASQAAINRHAVLAYLIPASLLLMGTIAGDQVWLNDTGAAVGGLAGLLGGLFLIRVIPRRAIAVLTID